jgi:[protein-PII] uridylyltransferase
MASSVRDAPAARLAAEFAALDAAYSRGHHGRWSARRRASLADAVLRELWAAAGGPEAGAALVAVGGYGRAELAPRSDLDLLLLHDGLPPDQVAGLAERILYPLWDARLAVGHAVRTVPQCLEQLDQLDAATAMLDARLLAGDPGLGAALEEALLGELRRDPAAFVHRLVAERDRRRERHGSVSSLLEPDLKEGAGGLRDVASLRWAARVGLPGGADRATGAPGDALDRLELADMLRTSERRSLAEGEEFLVRLRSALHLETGRKHDVPRLEHQPALAGAMGFSDEPGLPAVDALMRTTFEHARGIEHVADLAFDRLSLVPATRPDPAPEPFESAEEALEAVAAAAEAGTRLPAASLDRLERTDLPEEVRWSPSLLLAFLRILRAGERGADALESLDRVGVLVRLLPEWAAVRCRPQRDPYHRYTVDVHLLRTAAAMAGLLSGEAGDDDGDDTEAEAVRAIGDVDGALLGAFLHDIGKIGRGRHVAVGVGVAASVLARLGVDGGTRELALFLVEHHLLLSDTATRRDLADPDLVLTVSARVRDPERLAALYLLTVADGRSTGPHAWTPWRRALVRELLGKVERVLDRGEMGEEAADRLSEAEAALRETLDREAPPSVEAFLARMPPSYLMAVPAAVAASHFPLVTAPLAASEVRTLTAPGERPGTHAVTVICRDRPGLLARIAGAFALSGLSILTAQVFTTEDGVAVDLFEVEAAFRGEVDEDRWRRFRSTLRKALEERLFLDQGVRERRAHYRAPRADIPLEVTVDDEASDFFTVVEVSAADRVGLLYEITQALFEQGLDVHLAKVATYGERVIDAFYVRDALGRKLGEEPGAAGAVRDAIAARLATSGDEGTNSG